MVAWIVLQLADSAFPTGGFAHSAGLEALLQAGELRSPADLAAHCHDVIRTVTRGALPIVACVHADPARLAELDTFTAATLWSHVAARASRAQGRSLLDVAARAFAHPELVRAREALTTSPGGSPGHLAPSFGFVCRTLDVTREDTLAAYLHLAVRGTLSAAVRLGCAGPAEAQRLHHVLHPLLTEALAVAGSLGLSDVAQPAPLAELFGATHDRLYSRLFQS